VKKLIGLERGKTMKCMENECSHVQHVIVYVYKFFSDTNFAIHSTQNGILLEKPVVRRIRVPKMNSSRQN
jgi:hypothetical protein